MEHKKQKAGQGLQANFPIISIVDLDTFRKADGLE